MKHVTQLENWSVEVKQIVFRKTRQHGLPYSGSFIATVTDDKVHFELLNGNFTLTEIREAERFVKSLGFSKIHYKRKDKEPTEIKELVE